jgi:hypothetical protein
MANNTQESKRLFPVQLALWGTGLVCLAAVLVGFSGVLPALPTFLPESAENAALVIWFIGLLLQVASFVVAVYQRSQEPRSGTVSGA